jgi:predicted aminopeptidase
MTRFAAATRRRCAAGRQRRAGVLARLGRAARHALGAAGACCLLAGCSEIEFYWQGIAGQADLLARARPITDVIATSSDAVLRARLSRVQEIRAFASRELALPDNRSYTSYADLGRPFAVWNVFAAPALSLAPRQWCFPVAGCVAYRGYFAESDARAEAARFAAAGDDVHLSGVPAYSTLGYFDDPVLSTFVRYREVELARLIFHELAHQVVYVKDDTSFNESFATAVEEAGVARWLAAESARRGPAQAAELAAQAARGQRLRAFFRELVAATRDRLAALYASEVSDDEKRAGKAAAFTAMRAEYERWTAASGAAPAFDRWFAAGANNAGIVAAGLYADRVPQFASLLAAENGDLPRFYARVKALAELRPAEREATLAASGRP